MPRYIYTAKPKPDKIIRSGIDAESEQDAINKLIGMGYFPLSVESEVLSLDRNVTSLSRKVSNKDLVLFTRQLSSLIESGVHMVEGLNIISKQTTNKYLKAIIDDIGTRIKSGESLRESFSAHKGIFSQLYCAMLETGEASGHLSEVLRSLSGFLEKEEEFKDSLRAALAYPLFVSAVGVMTIIVLLVFVIPRLVVMFQDMGQVLPLATRILIAISQILSRYFWLILAIIFLFIFSLRRLYNHPKGRLSIDQFKLKIAVFGNIILKGEISRLARTLSLLISSGLAITSSLEISASVLQNQILKSEAQKLEERIRNGLSLSASFKESKFFPGFVANLIVIGEETGSLDKALLRVADDYEQEVNQSLKALTRLLEPVIILVMGLIVGFIVLAMLLPIFQINLIVK